MTKRTDLPKVFTIDPPMSRDLDDAIAARRTEGGWIIDVCVPDVAKLVAPDSDADKAARERVMTRYGGSFIREAMLPDDMTAKLSISPNGEQPLVWFGMTLDADLTVVDLRIDRIEHRSAGRLSYLEADSVLTDPRAKHHADILALWDVSCLLHARRRARTGAIFDADSHMATSEEGVLQRLSEKNSHQTHLVVMEIMILTNETLARHAHDNGIPIIYRNHRPRDMRSGFRQDVVAEMNLIETLAPEEAADRLRVLASRIGPAGFGTASLGHWGLDTRHYAWFTSPIRRYCDLINARVLLDGHVDPDAEATAAHIERVTREEREKSDAAHGDRARRAIARAARKGDVEELASFDLHTILRACADNGVSADVVEQEARRRLDGGAISGKDLESVFTHGRDVLSSAFQVEIADWIMTDRQRQIVFARDMVMRQRIERMPTGADGKIDLPAAMAQIAVVLDIRLPVGMDCGPDLEPVGNPKGVLLEHAATSRARATFEVVSRVGPVHEPRFTAEARWEMGDEVATAQGSAGTVKEATQIAAQILLDRLRLETPVSEGGTTPHPSTGNAKSQLLEKAVADKATTDFRQVARTGPDHEPTFTMEASYSRAGVTVNRQATARNKREAERMAAALVLQELGGTDA